MLITARLGYGELIVKSESEHWVALPLASLYAAKKAPHFTAGKHKDKGCPPGGAPPLHLPLIRRIKGNQENQVAVTRNLERIDTCDIFESSLRAFVGLP